MNRKRGTWLIWIGLLLIAAAFFLLGYNLWDANRAAEYSEAALEQMEQAEKPAEKPEAPEEPEIPEWKRCPEMEMPTVEIDGNLYIGTLEIPKLGLSLPIMSQWSDQKLKLAPCRYSGSAYQNNLVISGHNYRLHFANLKNLEEGDRLSFTDTEGNRFCYQVSLMETLKPYAIEEMQHSGWDLTLFTCTWGGKTRLTVRCSLTECA